MAAQNPLPCALTPGRPPPVPAASLPVLQDSGRLRRLLQPRYEALHVVKHVVQDVLGSKESRTLSTPDEALKARAPGHPSRPGHASDV